MRALSLIGLMTLLQACSDEKTRPETADKLKPVLVLVNAPNDARTPTSPLLIDNSDADADNNFEPPLAGGTVRLMFHFIGPEDMGPLTLTPTEPELRPLTLPISNWTQTMESATAYPGLKHAVMEVQAPLPTTEALTALWSDFPAVGFVRLRYTLVASDGVRELPVAGDFVVYRDNSVAGANEHLFGSTIDVPIEGEPLTDKTITISSTLKNAHDEPIKIGWYVSAGEIKNRRAASTEWELPGSGEYTLVFTVRGKESRNGDIQIRRVTLP